MSPIRDFSNPNNFSNPDTYKGEFWDFEYEEVHNNSGVGNFWYYLLVNGGNGTNDIGNSYKVEGIGFDKAIKIAYNTLVNYLTESSNYYDAYVLSQEAAMDLYGECSQEEKAVGDAWYAVGVAETKYTKDAVADFEITSKTYFCENAPVVVNFTNKSKNAESYLWDFGDGQTSIEENPVHTYQNNGNYTVKLTCNNNITCAAIKQDTETKNNYIEINPSLVKANFTADKLFANLNEEIIFTDLSCNGTEFSYNFGDGAVPQTATGQGPHSVKYKLAGTKTITLTMKDASGNTYTEIKNDYISISPDFVMSNYTETVCNVNFYSSQGRNKPYLDNENYTAVFYPAEKDRHLMARFRVSNFFKQSDDTLYIYNGENDKAPLIDYLTYNHENLFNYLATNSKGALTFVFKSGNTISQDEYHWWAANLECVDSYAVANFDISNEDLSIINHNETIFTDKSTVIGGNVTNWIWNFGEGAVPKIATGRGPHKVKYTTTNWSRDVKLSPLRQLFLLHF